MERRLPFGGSPITNFIKIEGTLLELPNMKSFDSGAVLATFKILNKRTYLKKTGEGVTDDTVVEFQTWNKKLMKDFGLWRIGLALSVEGHLKGSMWTTKEGKVISKVNFIMDSYELAGASIKDTIDEEIDTKKEELIDNHIFEELPF